MSEAKSISALAPARRGRGEGESRTLTPEQEARIQRLISENRPEQLKMVFALWSRAALKQLVERECGIKLSIGNYLKHWGFTPQKPIKKADEQRPEAVKAWLDNEYPAIEQRAKAEGAEIHWGDETAVVNTDVRGRSYAPAGKTPVTFAVGGTQLKAPTAPIHADIGALPRACQNVFPRPAREVCSLILFDGRINNGICERFHQTIQNEFYATAFRRKLYVSLEQLQAYADAWIDTYN